ncbi:hypothetical protein LXA43DRAFT_16970 [Ganoderma leucocontextum]|nr:hypothetical protein LXA43DRAFT_16970 [Ganoderma leucocontextum]
MRDTQMLRTGTCKSPWRLRGTCSLSKRACRMTMKREWFLTNIRELSSLREENARIQGELSRYTTSSNPLPRPPEHIPLVASLPRDPAASATNSVQRSGAPLGLGLPSVVAPSTQSRSSSNGSGGSTGSRRAPSVHFADPGHPTERQSKSKYKITADDLDVTPRPPITVVPTSQRPDLTSIRYPPNSSYAPRPGDSVVWVNGTGPPIELTEAEKEILIQRSRESSMGFTNSNPVSSLVVPSLAPPGSSVTVPPMVPPPVVPPPPILPPTLTARPAAETGSARMRVIPADAPVSGRSPLAWRPGPAHKEGYVKAFLPHLGGIGWIPEEEASKLPVRAWGTESRYPYVLAKEPSEVDDEWRRDHNGASPGPNPLQLIGVPKAPVAGPSRSAIQRTQYDAPPESSARASTLFRDQPRPSDRAIPVSGNGSNGSLSELAPASSASRSQRSSSRRRRAASNAEPLGLNLTSLPMPGPRDSEDPETQPSPASTWGTMESRNSSLGNLRLNNFGDPDPYTRAQSLEQLPIGELNGGPIVLTDAMTPRQGSSAFDDTRSISGQSIRSRDHHAEANAPGLLLNPSSGSSHVVSTVQDLEDVNRSLQRLADSQTRELPRHSQRSSRHSSHPSMSGDEADMMIGSRTGIALYSSRPLQHASNGSHNGRSSNDPSPPAHSRPHSGGSARDRAESTHSQHSSLSRQSSHSRHSSYSTHSAHNADTSQSTSDQRRARRASNASMLNHAPESATWTTIPSAMQPYGSSRGPYVSDARPPPSQESIPRSLQSNGDGLGLTFEAPSTSSAVSGNGEQASGIHAPRPVNGRRASQLIGNSWNARSGH